MFSFCTTYICESVCVGVYVVWIAEAVYRFCVISLSSELVFILNKMVLGLAQLKRSLALFVFIAATTTATAGAIVVVSNVAFVTLSGGYLYEMSYKTLIRELQCNVNTNLFRQNHPWREIV